jgi:Xaa-Pro aminopeptidase
MIERYKKILRDNRLDLILLTQQPNITEPSIHHLLGADIGDSFVFVTRKGAEVYASPLIKDQLRLPKYAKLSVCHGIVKEIKSRFKKPKIGVVSERLPMNWSKALSKAGRLVDVSDSVSNARAFKTPQEIVMLTRAARNTEDIFQRCFTRWKGFRTEKDVYSFLVDEASVYGLAFDPIVSSGRNSRIPHALPTTQKLKGFTIIDFAVKEKMYRADMTRTVYVGKPGLRELEVYNKVLKARDDSFAKIKVGISAREVDKVARDLLGENLMHSLGHGVGIDIHEPPFLRPTSKDKLVMDSVIALEPAFYGKDYGIRIEDMVHVAKKPRFISGPSKSLLILPRKGGA